MPQSFPLDPPEQKSQGRQLCNSSVSLIPCFVPVLVNPTYSLSSTNAYWVITGIWWCTLLFTGALSACLILFTQLSSNNLVLDLQYPKANTTSPLDGNRYDLVRLACTDLDSMPTVDFGGNETVQEASLYLHLPHLILPTR